MNEQIDKIYGAACILYGDLSEREFCEKFAELIIRNCADLVAPLGDNCGDTGYLVPSSRECARRLKQNFGVE
jgi:hypothetical protein